MSSNLAQEARRGLAEYWEAHPEAYLQMRDEQIKSCLDANGKVLKKHRAAHRYYMHQKYIFELMQSLKNKFKAVMGEDNAVHKDRA